MTARIASGGGFIPFDIGSIPSLLLWKAGRLMSGFSDMDPIASVNGGVGTLSQATEGLRPTYRTGGIGGLPYWSFDGGDALVSQSMSITDAVVWLVWNASVNGLLYEHGPGVNIPPNNGFYLYTDQNSTIQHNRPLAFSAKADASANWGLGSVNWITKHQMDGTSAGHLLYGNGALRSLAVLAAGNPGVDPYVDVLNIGSRDQSSVFITGNISEIVVCSPTPSVADIANVDLTLRFLYGTY